MSFPSATSIDGVRLYVSALPTRSEAYTIDGIEGTTATQVAQSSQTAQQAGSALATIAIPSAPYDGIRIDVTGNASGSRSTRSLSRARTAPKSFL
ncbi:MAG TPA: hypothetical protein VGH28_13355 [Polyangiaceae bacterium]